MPGLIVRFRADEWLRAAIVREAVLDRHSVSKDAPHAVKIFAMLEKVAVVGVGSVAGACAFALMRVRV